MVKRIIIIALFAAVSVVSGVPAYADLDTGLVAYYPFSGNANDASGNNNAGAVNGAVLTADRFGTPDSAYYFDGSSAFIQVPYNQSFDATAAGLTVTSWFKASSSQYAADGVYALIDKSHGDSGGYDDHTGWAVQAHWDGSYVCGLGFALGTGTDYLWHEACSTNSVLDDKWHQYSATYQGSTIKLYIDGLLKATAELAPGEMPASNTRDLFIGKHYALGRHFHGTIDDVRIYSRVLSDAEISTLGAAVSGCVNLLGAPLQKAFVNLRQDNEPKQTAQTGSNGCFAFGTVVPGKSFKLDVQGPIIP